MPPTRCIKAKEIGVSQIVLSLHGGHSLAMPLAPLHSIQHSDAERSGLLPIGIVVWAERSLRRRYLLHEGSPPPWDIIWMQFLQVIRQVGIATSEQMERWWDVGNGHRGQNGRPDIHRVPSLILIFGSIEPAGETHPERPPHNDRGVNGRHHLWGAGGRSRCGTGSSSIERRVSTRLTIDTG
jgi:hypothetical protein